MSTVLSIVAASALLWLAALLRLDPHRGEKGTSRRVAGFFLLGMLSIVPVSVMYLLYPYGLVLLGVPLRDEFVYQMLAGARDDGERLLARAEASLTTRDRLAFRRNLRRILAPGRGRRDGGFSESMLRTWLVVADLNRERVDPRPRAPARLTGA